MCTIGDLGSIIGHYDAAGLSGYPCNVVNLELTMDAPNDEDVRTLVEPAHGDALSEHRRWDPVANCEPSASIFRANERLDVHARGLLSRDNGVASRGRTAFQAAEVSLEREVTVRTAIRFRFY